MTTLTEQLITETQTVRELTNNDWDVLLHALIDLEIAANTRYQIEHLTTENYIPDALERAILAAENLTQRATHTLTELRSLTTLTNPATKETT